MVDISAVIVYGRGPVTGQGCIKAHLVIYNASRKWGLALQSEAEAVTCGCYRRDGLPDAVADALPGLRGCAPARAPQHSAVSHGLTSMACPQHVPPVH